MKKAILILGCFLFMYSCECDYSQEPSIVGEYSLRSAEQPACLDASWNLFDDFFDCTELQDEVRNSPLSFSGSLTINEDGSYKRTIVLTFETIIDLEFEKTSEGFISEISEDQEWDTQCCGIFNASNDCNNIRLKYDDGYLDWSILDLSNCDLDTQWYRRD